MSGNEGLQKLVLYSFSDRNFSDSREALTASDKVFTAPVNPESFTKNFKVDLDVRRGHGNQGTEARFKSTVPEELRLEFILDGTGTMLGYFDAYKNKSVHEQLDIFLKCAYNFDGDIHRPRFLLIVWGTEIRFRCVLANLDINYTLFKPDGSPLRARLTANFINYKAREERIAAERPNSPDLTHYRKVKQSDRLDNLCHSIYNDPKYVLQIAKMNGLTGIRNLPFGTDLYFPPFEKTNR